MIWSIQQEDNSHSTESKLKCSESQNNKVIKEMNHSLEQLLNDLHRVFRAEEVTVKTFWLPNLQIHFLGMGKRMKE